MGAWKVRGAALVLGSVLVVVMSGCGGNGDDGAADTTGAGATDVTEEVAEPVEPAPSEQGSDPTDPSTTVASGASSGGCPLTAEQVAEVMGGVVEVEGGAGSCSFFSSDGLTPSADFTVQLDFACEVDVSELGYTQPLEGLGAEAFAAEDAFGASVLVCATPPFEIRADVAGDGAADLAAATALAALVLAA